MTKQKKILITAGRSWISLDLARHLHAAGHKIYIADTSKYHVCRFSNAITKCFVIPSPRFASDDFITALVDIVKEEKIDFLLPSCEEIICLSSGREKFPSHCFVFCSPFELMQALHSKWQFICMVENLGLKTPKTHLISTAEELQDIPFTQPYILKPCYSRASQKIKKVNPPEPPPVIKIEPHNPWVAQEWIVGQRYCTYSICYDGTITAHSIYPVDYAIEGNNCLIFEAIKHPKIFTWIQEFVKKINFTGQIAFDFIEDADKELYPIECNPRATSGAHLFTKKSNLSQAILNETTNTIFSPCGTKRQIAIGMLVYGWRNHPSNKTFSNYFTSLLSTKDVIFQASDLIPFLTVPFIFLKYIAMSKRLKIGLPSTFTFDLEWNGESPLTTQPEPEKIQQAQ